MFVLEILDDGGWRTRGKYFTKQKALLRSARYKEWKVSEEVYTLIIYRSSWRESIKSKTNFDTLTQAYRFAGDEKYWDIRADLALLQMQEVSANENS